MKYIYMLRLCLFFFTCGVLFAEPSVSIRDTIIPRGEIYSIPIAGNFANVESANSIEFVFEYDQFIFDIKSVSTETSAFFTSQEPIVSSDLFSKPAKYRVKFTNTGILAAQSGNLFNLVIEGLAAPRDSAAFACTEVLVNDENISFTSPSAMFRTTGENIIQGYPTDLFSNYPNPFRGWTTFTFNLQDGGTAEFEIYNYFGTRVYPYKELSKYLHITQVSGENGGSEFSDYFGNFPAGKFTLQFTPSEDLFPSGLYLLTMKHNGKFYSQFFVYSK